MKYIVLMALLCCSVVLQAQSFDQKLTTQLDAQLEAYVEGVAPGMAVGIVKDGQIAYQNYLGYSNLEHQVKIDENTRFNIASNGKQFTALCILELIDGGKLTVDDDIREYLPELYKNRTGKITISQLLTHSSGIRDAYDLWALQGKTWWKQFLDNDDALELIQSQTDLNFEPGSNYSYSNSNYILLAEIIKRVSGEKFSDFASQLFQRLDMNATAFLTNYMAVIPNKARPYGNWNGWREYPAITEIHGDGALFSSLTDQLRWEVVVQTKGSNQQYNAQLIEQSQNPIPNANIPNYGHGLMLGTYKGLDYAYHDGNTGAYNATFLRFPGKTLSVVVLANNGNIPTNYLAKQLADIVLNLGATKPVFASGPPQIEKLENIPEVLGDYKTQSGTIIKITQENGSLYRKIYQQDPVKLINEQGNLFHYATNRDLKIAFTRNEEGRQIFTIYLPSQKPNVGIKLPSGKITDVYKGSLDGRFYNDETDTEIVIKFLKDNSYSITKNGRERKGELILEDLLRMNSYEIKIHRGLNNAIDGLLVKNKRIDNVKFRKL